MERAEELAVAADIGIVPNASPAAMSPKKQRVSAQAQTPQNASAMVPSNGHERADRYKYSGTPDTPDKLGSDGREETSYQRKEVKKTSHSGGETIIETLWQKNGTSWGIKSTTTIEKDRQQVVVGRETRDAYGNLRR